MITNYISPIFIQWINNSYIDFIGWITLSHGFFYITYFTSYSCWSWNIKKIIIIHNNIIDKPFNISKNSSFYFTLLYLLGILILLYFVQYSIDSIQIFICSFLKFIVHFIHISDNNNIIRLDNNKGSIFSHDNFMYIIEFWRIFRTQYIT